MPSQKKSASSRRIGKKATATKVKLADGLLSKSHQNLLQAMAQGWELVSDAVSVTDPEHNRLVYVNPAWVRLYKYSQAECLGQSPKILNLKSVSSKLRQTVMKGAANTGWQGRLLNQDAEGNVFPVDLSSAPLQDESGSLIGLLGVARPVRQYNLTDERIQNLVQRHQESLSLELQKLLETALIEEDPMGVASGPHKTSGKADKTPNNHNSEPVPGIGRLTERELEIFTLIGRGLSTRDIAGKLKVSAYTVQTHRNHIKDKLSLPDSAAITYWAFQWAHRQG